LLLCVAEPERPGRIDGLDSHLFDAVTGLLGMRFAKGSGVIAAGRAGLGRALQQARSLMAQGRVSRVLVAAADSLLDWPTLQSLAEEGRLLGAGNSNGFMPGEAGAALLLGSAGSQPALQLRGLGFGTEPSPLASTTPLRCDGLATAISSALGEAGLAFQDLDLRMADLSGEHYYFKEAALAVSRILRAHKEELDLWHPAECTGETGAAAPLCMMAYADVACRRGYSPGPRVLLHFGNDAGQRVAAVLQYGVAA